MGGFALVITLVFTLVVFTLTLVQLESTALASGSLEHERKRVRGMLYAKSAIQLFCKDLYTIGRVRPDTVMVISPDDQDSKVEITTRPWGQDLLVSAHSALSDRKVHALIGSIPQSDTVLVVYQGYAPINLAGKVHLEGVVLLPVPRVRQVALFNRRYQGSGRYLIQPLTKRQTPAVASIDFLQDSILNYSRSLPFDTLIKTYHRSFDSTTLILSAGHMDLDSGYSFSGNIILHGQDSLRLHRGVKIQHCLIVSSNIHLGSGVEISGHLIADGTVLIKQARLLAPSSVGFFSSHTDSRLTLENAKIHGQVYLKGRHSNQLVYKSDSSSEIIGRLWVENGGAQVQGVIRGQCVIEKAVIEGKTALKQDHFMDVEIRPFERVSSCDQYPSSYEVLQWF